MRTTVDAPPRGTAAATAARALGGEFELPERRETPSLVARVTSTQSAPVDIIVEEALPAKVLPSYLTITTYTTTITITTNHTRTRTLSPFLFLYPFLTD